MAQGQCMARRNPCESKQKHLFESKKVVNWEKSEQHWQFQEPDKTIVYLLKEKKFTVGKTYKILIVKESAKKD